MSKIKNLKLKANNNRKSIIDMIYKAKAGHPGGSLSIIDILTAIYELDVDFNEERRSRVVLSKGHTAPAQYAVLEDKGVISKDEFKTFRHVNSRLQGHPHIVDVPETDATTGLLGQGLSIGVGMAIAKKYNKDTNRVYAIVGDGELHEGQIWEAIMQAAHYKLNNLVLVVDYNKLSSSGPVNEVINVDSVSKKLSAFDFNTIEIDGNNMEQVVAALEIAKNEKEKPVAIIANTIKGKGISFMENNAAWHSGALNDEQYSIACKDLNTLEEMIING